MTTRTEVERALSKLDPANGATVVKGGRVIATRPCKKDGAACLVFLDAPHTDWWPRDRVPKRPHDIRRDS